MVRKETFPFYLLARNIQAVQAWGRGLRGDLGAFGDWADLVDVQLTGLSAGIAGWAPEIVNVPFAFLVKQALRRNVLEGQFLTPEAERAIALDSHAGIIRSRSPF
jgi:hypothetical protein